MNKNIGGIETFLLNTYRAIDRDNVKFDFLSYAKDYALKPEFDALGALVYSMPSIKNPIRYFSFLSKLLKRKRYDIIHFHKNSAANIIPIVVVKLLGAKRIFIHSHNTNPSVDNGLSVKALHYINRPLLNAIAHKRLACSEAAAVWLFGKRAVKAGQVTVIRNGIDTAEFKFNPEVRDAVRKGLGVADKYVIGHVGRFSSQKNHTFLIDVFAEVAKKELNAVLVSVGEGELKPQIEKKVRKLGLVDKVLFLGVRNDVSRIYQAMDVFVLPSLYEGFGIVSAEAMASGLPCVLSDSVPKEAKILDSVEFLSLSETPEKWADAVCEATSKRGDYSTEFVKAGYEINDAAAELMDIYLRLARDRERRPCQDFTDYEIMLVDDGNCKICDKYSPE